MIDNRTPFSAEHFLLPDADGQERHLIVLVASFAAARALDELAVAEEQSPVRIVDQHWGAPDRSSVRYEGSLALEKPRVDVILNGAAYAPGGQAARKVEVGLEAGTIKKRLVVYGDRRWSGLTPSAPRPFTRMPLVWERAFGGTSVADPGLLDRRNPVGVGYQLAASQDEEVESELPNVEYPDDQMQTPRDQPRPAGFSHIGRSWVPRVEYAGTYDESWLDRRWPLLPVDFNHLHNQSAPQDQQCASLRGGERVRVVNLTPEGHWSFRLPLLDVPAHLFYDDRHVCLPLRVDTVLFEPDRYRVELTARLGVPVERNRAPLREVVLGHLQRGWIRARMVGKTYFDTRGRDGSAERPVYHLYFDGADDE
jgi:hypothetical protein